MKPTDMCTRALLMIPVLSLAAAAAAQTPQADTVIVPLAETSRIIFTIEDRGDIQTLRHYDFQQLFDDILDRLDTTARADERAVATRDDEPLPPFPPDEPAEKAETNDRDRDGRRNGHSFNIDLGLNNYLAGDQFPEGSEPYAVRPWGSWYLGLNSVYRSRIGRHVFVEMGVGVSWYSFKFQNDNTAIIKDPEALTFVADSRDVDFIKSKLSATFINASLVPVLDFSDNPRKGKGQGFRVGLGPYLGYRLSSKTKLVYEVDDKRVRDKDHDNFYLNSLRYGLRFQVGIRSADFFINYDMNELFAAGRGPELNAVSFGVIF